MRISRSSTLDFDIALDIRPQFDFGEGGMAAIGAIIRAEADQTVHPFFALQITKGVIAFHADGDTLEAGFIAAATVEYFRLVAMLLHPAQIHAFQHLRPILGIDTAGAGVNGEYGVFAIVVA